MVSEMVPGMVSGAGGCRDGFKAGSRGWVQDGFGRGGCFREQVPWAEVSEMLSRWVREQAQECV
ncbi:hypothetical protein KML24008_21070 [Alistipes onderdonkii]